MLSTAQGMNPKRIWNGVRVTDNQREKWNTLLKAKELGDQLGISAASIYRRRSLGEPLPPAIKIGGSIRWRQSDVDAWLESQLEVAK